MPDFSFSVSVTVIFHLHSSCLLNLICVFSDFVPIDLDEWWAQRFLANIDKLSWLWSARRRSRAEEVRPKARWGILMGQSAQMWFRQTDTDRRSWEPLGLLSSDCSPDRLHMQGCRLTADIHLIFSLKAETLLWNAIKSSFEEILDHFFF